MGAGWLGRSIRGCTGRSNQSSVAFESRGEEFLVDHTIVEPGHGSEVEPQCACCEDKVCSLECRVPSCRDLGQFWAVLKDTPRRRVTGTSSGSFSLELHVGRDDRGRGRTRGFCTLPRARAGLKRSLVSDARKKTMRTGQRFMLVGPHFIRSYSSYSNASATGFAAMY